MSWRDVSVGEVCDLSTGGTPSKENTEYFDNSDILWLVSGDIHKREIFDCNGRITELGYKNSNAKFLPIDSVLIALNGQGKTRGTVALLRVRATCNQSIVAITPKNKDELDSKYLFYYLDGKYEYIRRLTGDSGNDRRGLNMPLIRKIYLPLPPLKTQQKIVAKLDAILAEIDKATAAAEANAKNAEALFQSYLTEVFERGGEGWSNKKISEIAKIKGGKRVPKGYELKNEVTPYVYLRVTNFSENGDIDTTDLRYVDNEVWSGIKNYIINSEDLYISIAGTIGRTGMVSAQLSGSLLTENACRLVFNNDINNKFVYYFTKSSSFISQTVEQTRTTAQPKLALSRLGEITLAIPSLDEQLEINKKLDLMTTQISIYKNCYEQKIIELNALKQSILKQAFNGELVKE